MKLPNKTRSQVSPKRLKSRLEKRLAALSTNTFGATVSTPLPDINDEASREAERSVTAQLASRRKVESLRLQSALRRLDEGTYGICGSCEELIDPRRLEVNPTAVLCAACQEEREEEEEVSDRWQVSA